ncbi:MAG TPA: alkaline phosphatase family protein [Candidatus Angelobacter sp.]|nr:alkaline phosphatase family protein [Candidatus Angelobacter sp.]
MSKLIARVCLIALVIGICGGSSFAANDDRDRDNDGKIRHVFVIVLENEGFDVTFGPNSKAPFLSKTLTSRGVLLNQYFGTGHASLDNYISMISGQAATPETRNDCFTYADFNLTGITPDGQAIGSGCVYPASIKTVADQLKAAGKTWRAYMGDMGNDPKRESATCGHAPLNQVDNTEAAEAPSLTVPLGDQYAARHNPFVYFHSIIDSPDCNSNVVNLNQLPQDLASESTTPNLVFITPNLCDDGHDAPCVTGQPGGLVSADLFLQKWVPLIMSSEAFRRDGLLVINFDEAGAAIEAGPGGVVIDFEGAFCCNQQPGPNLGPFPQSSKIQTFTLTFKSYGGDRTGAVLLSPFLKAGTVSDIPFNHYSLLKTIEDIFDLDEHLGYAAQPGLMGFFGCVNSDVAIKDHEQFPGCKSH